MWIATLAVPLVLLAVPLWLAHLEDRVVGHARPPGALDGPHATEPATAAEPARSPQAVQVAPAPLAHVA
jgi:hypothetical protein